MHVKGKRASRAWLTCMAPCAAWAAAMLEGASIAGSKWAPPRSSFSAPLCAQRREGVRACVGS